MSSSDRSSRPRTPTPAQRRARAMVEAVTATWPGGMLRRPLPLRCHRRPGRRPCGGVIQTEEVASDAITWSCTAGCGERGRLTGWRGVGWSLAGHEVPGALEEEGRVLVRLPWALHAPLVRGLRREAPAALRILRAGRGEPRGVRVLVPGAAWHGFLGTLVTHGRQAPTRHRYQQIVQAIRHVICGDGEYDLPGAGPA